MLAGRAEAAVLEAGEEGPYSEGSDLWASLQEPVKPPTVGAESIRRAAGELLGEQEGFSGVAEGVSRGFFCG
jgi:hypothetical protein